MEDVTGYRRVLHEWASRKLEKYGHLGPFDIVDVHVFHERGNGSIDPPDRRPTQGEPCVA